jgi:hypothetical protein
MSPPLIPRVAARSVSWDTASGVAPRAEYSRYGRPRPVTAKGDQGAVWRLRRQSRSM